MSKYSTHPANPIKNQWAGFAKDRRKSVDELERQKQLKKLRKKRKK